MEWLIIKKEAKVKKVLTVKKERRKTIKKTNKAIVIGKGELCPKCLKEMERRSHPLHYVYKKSFYFTKWDYCNSCKHVQHYDKFKSNDWKEAEKIENFFNSLKITD